MLHLDPLNILIALAMLTVLSIIAYKGKVVTKSGLFAAFALGLAIWLLASWAWFFIVLVFFVVTAQFTHYKYKIKREHGAAQEKGGARDWSHVLANGGLPLAIIIVGVLTVMLFGQINAFGRLDVGLGFIVIPASLVIAVAFAAFLGALATATADTLATEIGLLNPFPPRLITNLRKVVLPGTSGGISVAGELATVLGTLLIGGIAAILSAPFWINLFGATLMPELIGFAPTTMIIVAMVGGIFGCTVDSLLGATIQGMWSCKLCGKQTEKKSHCGESAQYLRGNHHLDNHMVNLVSCLVGAFVAIGFYLLLLGVGFA
ncbi:MAG: TIGR00297 family protein [Candidatus Thorarchaeota archaeon]